VKPGPLPRELQGRVFLRSEAKALGVGDSRLGRHGLAKATHGVWLPAEPRSLRERASAVVAVLPVPAAFSHETAAGLLGLPLPPRLATDERLHVVTDTDTAQRRRPSWVGHRGLESRSVVDVDGLPVVGALDTWLDLASYAVGRRRSITVADLVMVGDAMLGSLAESMHPGASPSDLRDGDVVDRLGRRIRAVLGARVRPRGKAAVVEALPLLRLGVRSPQESRARVMFVQSGLPEPEVNVPIYADDGLTWLAEGDLVWRRRVGSEVRKVVGEYQGAYHAERAQRSRDSERSERLRDHGWTVHEVWAEDLNQPGRRWSLVRRVARSLDVDPATLRMIRWL
jgi:hypothetical protein